MIIRGIRPIASIEHPRSPGGSRSGTASFRIYPTTNDNWRDTQEARGDSEHRSRPAISLESAIVATLQPGAYTAILQDRTASQVGLVEVC